MGFNEIRQRSSSTVAEDTENTNCRDTSLLRLAVALDDKHSASGDDSAFWIGSIVWDEISIPAGTTGQGDLSYGEASR
jgi:hypothetical protein